ncbi:MAG TPA: ethanolamine ammonia lyase-activating protein [Chloroflexota bacterium]|nr:ethanolamine ammonia lyase-activating protein [Chloroflexota bacterium]
MEERADGGRPIRRETAYQAWQKGEGIPSHSGSYVTDLYHVDVAPWPRVGQKGAFINLADQQDDDAWVVEIAPGGRTEVLHHLFEATVLVLDGRGATTFWQKDGPKQTVEWQRGSVFSPPINSYYQHFNLDGQRPARLFGVTLAPMLINLFRNPDFVFNDDYPFRDRYDSSNDYFTSPGYRDETRAREWVTNFIPDIRSFKLDANDPRGLGSYRLGFTFSGNQMVAHSSEWPVGTYMKGHRHGVGAHVVILEGIGYSLLWFEGEPRQKVPWKDGSVLSPKDQEYHQHFNTGPEPVRYLAFRLGAADLRRWGRNMMPDQIESEDEDPAIYDEYEAECAKNGVKVTLPRPAYNRR